MANRKERRWQLRVAKMLRIKNMYGPFTEVGQLWYGKTREEGKKLFEANRERDEKRLELYLADKEASMKSHYESLGYSEAKVEKLLEGWRLLTVKFDDTYRADRKAATQLFREASEMN